MKDLPASHAEVFFIIAASGVFFVVIWIAIEILFGGSACSGVTGPGFGGG